MSAFRRLWHRLFGRGVDSDRATATPPTRLIVGLGNPGGEYAATRHNIGFRVVELLAERFDGDWRVDGALEARVCRIEIDKESCLLIEPQRFMNRSGRSVRTAIETWPTLDPGSSLLIIYDEIDLPTGRLRLRPRGGSGGHRGIGDVLTELDTKEIPRLRVGVGHPGSADGVTDWVLERFSPEEEALVVPGILERAADAIEATIREGLTSAMGQFNVST